MNARLTHSAYPQWAKIYLAGGCFWGMEGYFSKLAGVRRTRVGYANGQTEQTSYEQLKWTDHAETLELEFDQHLLSLEEVLLHFYRVIDPTSIDRQGADVGRQYRTGIFWTEPWMEKRILTSLAQLQKQYAQPIVVVHEPLRHFIPAEEWHQKYLEKNPGGYCHIPLHKADEPLQGMPNGEGKTAMDWSVWKEEDQEQRKARIGEKSFAVTQEEDTEAPFTHAYEKETDPGIYVDIVSGQPLFSSRDKFDAGCGWPSFTRPIQTGGVHYRKDHRLARERIEVRSQEADSHLGHVFPDGPTEQGGLRYCINGAALRFVPLDQMEEEGYGQWIPLVKERE